MKRKIAPFIENISESTAACLVTMVQGNLLILGVGHWVIASRTGVIAGVVAAVAILLVRTQRRWVTSAVLGAGLQKATGDVPTTMRNMTTVRGLVAKLGT